MTLRSPDFRVDLDELRAAVTPRTRFMLLNTPHNPTGTVLTRAELDAVAALAVEHDLPVVTDEVYEHLVFDGSEHVRSRPCRHGRAHADPVERRQVVVADRLEGRLGHRPGPPRRRRRRGEDVADLTSGAPLQPAVAIALDEHGDWPLPWPVAQERRDLLVPACAAPA